MDEPLLVTQMDRSTIPDDVADPIAAKLLVETGYGQLARVAAQGWDLPPRLFVVEDGLHHLYEAMAGHRVADWHTWRQQQRPTQDQGG